MCTCLFDICKVIYLYYLIKIPYCIMKSLRSSSKISKVNYQMVLDDLPTITNFQNTKLPLLKEVVAVVYHVQENDSVSFDDAIKKVRCSLIEHWKQRNIYTKSDQAVFKSLKKYVDLYRKYSRKDAIRLLRNGKETDDCIKFNEDLNKLFDIFCEDSTRRKRLETESGVPMLKEDFAYLESMRTCRTAICANVDVTWHKEQNLKQIRAEKQRRNQSAADFTGVSLDADSLSEEENVDVEDDFIENNDNVDDNDDVVSGPATKKRRATYIQSTPTPLSRIGTRSGLCSPELNDDYKLIYDNRLHVRDSEKRVHDEIYQTFAELDGHGFSYHESGIAITTVVNRLLGCNWKMAKESDRESKYDDDESENIEKTFDEDTLPTRSTTRKKLKQIYVHSLSLVADKIVESHDTGSTLTHATDSTTRKTVGSFAPAGIHVDREDYLPLPTLPIASETTKNISEGIKTDFKILEAASKHSAETLYSCVDVHMTDSTAHNKGIADTTAELMNRENPAGQVFCNVHTTLGFDKGMSTIVNEIEIKMKMENIFKGFLISFDIDEKNDTVSLTFVSWVLSLFGPDNIQKPWNYYDDFKTFLNRAEKKEHLFLLKDARFAMLSRSCAIVSYHWDDFALFLDQNDYITNKLACLVRDGMAFEYIQVIIAVIAAFGVHLVSPFFVKTKGKSKHTELKTYFTSLYCDLMTEKIDDSFFTFEKPFYKCVSGNIFQWVKDEDYYGDEVLDCITAIAAKRKEECESLANLMRHKMAEVLSMQRGKYYGFGDHQDKKYHVFDQSSKIDDVITQNIQLERECGDHDHRLKKKGSLSTVSRGNILKKTTKLRDEAANPSEFRKMGNVVKVIENLEAEWNQKQQSLREVGLSKKEAQKLNVDQRKLIILEKLKLAGGPFTSAEQIDSYLEIEKDQKVAQKRLREEVTYARDTSTSLPRVHQLFKMMSVDKTTRKRKLLSATDFATNLKTLLGNSSTQCTITMEDFRNALLANELMSR